ncbi:MAG: 1-acyl-sn-glycerol-3-phosphate acyltransferase, partial [Aestuariivirgaceae bacterium]
VYGLAENAVGLAFSHVGQRPIVDLVSRDSLPQTAMATPAGKREPHPMSFVSSGVPLPGNEVRIVDMLGREVAERQQGRLEFKGPSSTQGYYRNPKKTETLFNDDWLDSSDLAYTANGNIFITGRVKDIIIKAGRNIYPEEIEEAVGDLPDIRKGCVAAFASTDARTGSERLIVVAETRSTDPAILAKLEQDVGQTVNDIVGVPADEVIIAPPHTVPKTSSGKIRRSTIGEQYAARKLGQPVRALWLQVLRLGLLSGAPRLRRLMRTMADLAYAGWWWPVIIVIGTATWTAVLMLPSRKLRWAFVRTAAQLALRLLHIPIAVSGQERLALDTGVLAINHSSYFDVVVLAAVLPGEPIFVAKRELSGQFVAGPFLRRLGAQFADRKIAQTGLEDVEVFKSLVRRGQQLVVFPEATFFRMPGLLQFRLGAFTIACATDTLVLPIAVNGTRSILRGGQWFPRRGAVRVEVLEPVVPHGHDFSAAVDLRDRVRSEVLAHCGEPDMAAKEVVFTGDGNDQASG